MISLTEKQDGLGELTPQHLFAEASFPGGIKGLLVLIKDRYGLESKEELSIRHRFRLSCRHRRQLDHPIRPCHL